MKKYISLISIIITFFSFGSNHRQSETGTIRDIDGNVYTMVKIDNQWWTAENLKVTRAPQDNPIKGYYYEDDSLNPENYGSLYTSSSLYSRGENQRNSHPINPRCRCLYGCSVSRLFRDVAICQLSTTRAALGNPTKAIRHE